MAFNFLAPLAIKAGMGLAGKFLGGRGKIKGAKEDYKKRQGNLDSEYEERLAGEGNREDARLASVQGISEALGGSNRAISPAVLAAMLKRRASAVRRRQAVDESKGAGLGLAGSLLGDVGQLAGDYIAGSNPNAVSGGMPSTLRSDDAADIVGRTAGQGPCPGGGWGPC